MISRFFISFFSVLLTSSFLTFAYGADRPLETINVGVLEVSVLQSPLFVAIDAGAFKAIKNTLEVLSDEIPKAKGAKAEDFIDITLLKEIEASGFVDRLYGK